MVALLPKHTRMVGNTTKRSAWVGVFSLMLVTLGGAPAYAVDPYGSLHTINAAGGTTTTDGLKIDVASGQLQITRAGATQLYGALPLPDPLYANAMYNYFSVTFASGANDLTIDAYEEDISWVSGTSSVNLSADGKSGSIVNTLTSGPIPDFDDPIVLEVTFSYTYPDQYLTVSTALTLPSGWTHETRLYWNGDTTLDGVDDGNQFEGASTSGQQLRGVVSIDGTSIQAFRQVPGQSLFSWAGYLDCPWGTWGCLFTDDNLLTGNNLNLGGWLVNNEDAPNKVSPSTNIDNGLGVSMPAVSTAGTHRASFELIFVDCDPVDLSESAQDHAVACISEKVPPTPSDDPEDDSSEGHEEVIEDVALVTPALASTGTSSLVLLLSSLTLLATGVALVALRRRARS